jgi:hypothetical protein
MARVWVVNSRRLAATRSASSPPTGANSSTGSCPRKVASPSAAALPVSR